MSFRSETFNEWQRINSVKQFFYLRYCKTGNQSDLNTFTKWREYAHKAHLIMLAHLWSK